MSGPISSLKKSRKTPLPTNYGLKNVPYKTNEGGYSHDEAKLLDEITTNMAASRLKEPKAPLDPFRSGLRDDSDSVRSSPAPGKTAPSDNELMGLMMSRLANLESRLQFQSKEMAEKDKKIRILEEKISILIRTRGSENQESGSKAELEKKCLLLQQQVHEMEAFLADYGMIWVGDESDPSSDVYQDMDLETIPEVGRENTWMPEQSVPGNDFHMDFSLVVKNVEELNSLAGDGEGEIMKTADGARIKAKDSVPLILYANGIVMFSGPFRPYSDAETQRCMQDIMDGYFPSELQNRFPDGIPFTLTDKRGVHFKDKREAIFKGQGQMLGGETRPSRLVPSNLHYFGSDSQNKATMAVENEDGDTQLEVESELPAFATGPKLSVDQFLNRIPQSVIKQGKVIDVRQSLGETLKGGPRPNNDVTVIETSAVKAMKERLQLSEEKRPPSARDLTTLRIKSECGNQVYVLKMRFTDTIGDVRQYLDDARAGGDSSSYQLMSAFPRKCYDKNAATLKECGLVPNATLHLRPA